VGFDSAWLSGTALRGHWCDIIVLNAHVSTEVKSYATKDSFYKELDHFEDLGI
jgi:hypothetical protein